MNAQNKSAEAVYTVSGRVIDDSQKSPVEFANVILYHLSDSVPAGFTTTDEGGNFTVIVKNTGDYRMVVSYLGYNNFELKPITLTSGAKKKIMGDIKLEQSQQMLSEVVVTGQKRQILYKLDRQVIEAAGFLSAAGGTAVDILMQVPSIRVDAEGEVTFRGSSGFKVYIDGKPSSLGGAAALEQMSAGQIENIEVLSTPSARNSADGAVGIINITTKKLDMEGWSGMVNLMGSSVWSRNIDFLFALRKKNFRWQLSGEASSRYVLSDYDQLKTISTPELLTTDHSTGERERNTELYYLRSAFDWFRGSTTWSAAFMGGYRDRWRGGELHYEDTYENTTTGEKTYGSFNGKDFVHLYEYQLRGDLGMEHNFGRKGHTLTASLYGLYEGNAMENFQTDLWDMQGKQVQGHRAWEYEYRFTGQINADYVYPFKNGNGKFESGYEMFTYTEDGDYKIDMFNPTAGEFVRRDDLYNKYLFRRDIHSLYAMVSDTYAGINYQIGLRGEYTYRKLGNNLKWAENSRNRFDLFPSIHLSYPLDDKSQLRLAYARRITQPELFYMEPYVVYVDFNTAQKGNPYIKPEYTNSIEAGYTRNFDNNTVSATIFHRARKDKIERLRVPYQNTVTLDSMANVGNDYSTGIDLSTALQLNQRWNLDANTSFYYYSIRNQFKVEDDDEESWNWQLAVNNNYDLTKNTRLRLEAYYVGPMVSTQGRVDGFFYMNFTVRQQLLKRKLTASLVVRDIFSTAEYIHKRPGVGLESLSKIYPRSPLFTLSLTYTFNNFKFCGKSEKANHDMFEGTNR